MRVAVNLRPLVSHYVQQLRTTTGISPLNTASHRALEPVERGNELEGGMGDDDRVPVRRCRARQEAMALG